MKIHHVGYLTNNIEETIREFALLGYNAGEVYDDNIQCTRICLLISEENEIVELVQPFEENRQMMRMLNKRGSSPYHVCYEVDSVVEVYHTLLNQEGWINVFEPVKAVALENRLITYFYNTKMGLIEFVNKL